jgi:hypothetical protein
MRKKGARTTCECWPGLVYCPCSTSPAEAPGNRAGGRRSMAISPLGLPAVSFGLNSEGCAVFPLHLHHPTARLLRSCAAFGA